MNGSECIDEARCRLKLWKGDEIKFKLIEVENN